MQLIVITPDKTYTNETEIVNTFFEMGLARLHIRKKEFNEHDYRKYIEAINPQYHAKLVIHSYFHLYKELGLGGIHLNSMLRQDPAIWSQIQGIPPSAISTSFHSWDEIAENDFHYGYVFISPIFDSISKKGYKGAIQLEQFEQTKNNLAEKDKYCPEIVGLGGVSKDTLPVMIQYGFSWAALLGAIWESDNPTEAFAAIREIIR